MLNNNEHVSGQNLITSIKSQISIFSTPPAINIFDTTKQLIYLLKSNVLEFSC